jgi:hypothetical protein
LAEFIITGRLIGLNEIIEMARRNKYAAAKQKKEETERVSWEILRQKVPTFSKPITIRFTFIEPNRKRDPDGILSGASKVILDALVQSGRIPNDTRRWIKGIEAVFEESDDKNPYIKVEIIEQP